MTDQAQRIKKVSGIRPCDLPEERSIFQFDPDVVDQPLAAIGHYKAILRLISDSNDMFLRGIPKAISTLVIRWRLRAPFGTQRAFLAGNPAADGNIVNTLTN